MDNHSCRTCHRPFDSWDELANHILSQIKIKDDPHKKDRAGTVWAKRYRHRNAINKMKQIGREFNPRTALTEEQKQSRENSRRELSEKTEYVPVKCPRCKTGSERFIEIEYVESPEAWIESNCYIILCDTCR